ncbi:MAG: hypothetical protein IM613_12970 [Cytophagales bacterium]|nr:hypothetical protein [Cytophagales bacterium]
MEYKRHSISFRRDSRVANLYLSDSGKSYELQLSEGHAHGELGLSVITSSFTFKDVMSAYVEHVLHYLQSGWFEDGSGRPFGYRQFVQASNGAQCLLPFAVNRNQALKLSRSPNYVIQNLVKGQRVLLSFGENVSCFDRNGNYLPNIRVELDKGSNIFNTVLDCQYSNSSFYLVDCIRFNGSDITDMALLDRLLLLDEHFDLLRRTGLDVSLVDFEILPDRKVDLLDAAIESNHDGVIFKESSSRYSSGRNRNWLKHMLVPTVSLIVMSTDSDSLRLGVFGVNGDAIEVARIEGSNKNVLLGDIVEVSFSSAKSKYGLSLIGVEVLGVREDVLPHQCSLAQFPGVCF